MNADKILDDIFKAKVLLNEIADEVLKLDAYQKKRSATVEIKPK